MPIDGKNKSMQGETEQWFTMILISLLALAGARLFTKHHRTSTFTPEVALTKKQTYDTDVV
jgi:hypothetical protein